MSWVLVAELPGDGIVVFGPYDDEMQALEFAFENLFQLDEREPTPPPPHMLPVTQMSVICCITTTDEARAYLLYVKEKGLNRD